MNKIRCEWVNNDQLYIDYHDNEWGKPVKNDKTLFEFLVLESFQAGLSWYSVLKKRESFRNTFDNFDIVKVSNYDEEKINELFKNKKIIRHKGKIEATVNNAKLFIEIQKEFGSFSNFIWNYVDNKTIRNNWNTKNDIPITSDISNKISRDLKNRGFKYIGSKVIYAYMQAVGMVNDHIIQCFAK